MQYYHLHRPIKHVEEPIVLSSREMPKYEETEVPARLYSPGSRLYNIGIVQWGKSRVTVHWRALLGAAAALDDREKASQADATILAELYRPMLTERHLLERTQFEGGRRYHSLMQHLLVEFATYGTFGLLELMEDYKLDETQAFKVMSMGDKYWELLQRKPTVYGPSKEMRDILKEVD